MRVVMILFLVSALMVAGILLGRFTAPGSWAADSIPDGVGRHPFVTVTVMNFVEEEIAPGTVTGTSAITFRNRSDKPMKVKLPVIRQLIVWETGVSYHGPPQEGSLAQDGIVEIEPGASQTLQTRFAISFASRPTIQELYDGRGEPSRYGWVFNVPDGEGPDGWLSGTIISDPVEWRPADDRPWAGP